jgi:hypothetical protein
LYCDTPTFTQPTPTARSRLLFVVTFTSSRYTLLSAAHLPRSRAALTLATSRLKEQVGGLAQLPKRVARPAIGEDTTLSPVPVAKVPPRREEAG